MITAGSYAWRAFLMKYGADSKIYGVAEVLRKSPQQNAKLRPYSSRKTLGVGVRISHPLAVTTTVSSIRMPPKPSR